MALFRAQSAPSAASWTTLYTATADTAVSSITVCNRSATPTSFRIALRLLGAALADANYVYYDQIIDGNSTYVATIGPTLINTDKLDVYATLATLSFQVYGESL